MKFSTQALLVVGGTLFLMKGGASFLIAMWRLVVPILIMGGAYYMIRKAVSPAQGISGKKTKDEKFTPREEPKNGAVIEICPHCLSEVGSCPKCRKKKFF